MSHLHLEELEPRRLLSATLTCAQPSQALEPATLTDHAAPRDSSVDHDTDAGQFETGAYSSRHADSRTVDVGFQAVRAPEILVIILVSSPNVPDPAPATATAAVSPPAAAASAEVAPAPAAHSAARPGAPTVTTPDGTSLNEVSLTLSGQGAGDRAASVVSGNAPAQLGSASVPRLEGPVNPAGFRVEAPPLSADRYFAGAALVEAGGPVRTGIFHGDSPPVVLNPVPAPAVALQGGESTGEASAPLLARWSAALSALPAAGLSDLDRGMREFLDQLEHLGGSRPGHGTGSTPYLWIAAGALAAVACEMARRQLKAAPQAPALECFHAADFSPGSPEMR